MSFPGNPLAVVKVVTTPSFILASPSLVPTHSDPSFAASRHCTSLPGSAGFECSSNSTKPVPSNRTSPTSVPSHRYPSAVCASACTVFCGRPFSITQLCRFRLASGVAGSSAASPAAAQTKSSEASACAILSPRGDHPIRKGL